MRKSLFRAVFCREVGGKKSRSVSPPPRSCISHRWIFVRRLASLKPLLVLKKKPMESRSGRRSGPLPSPSAFLFFLLCSLFGFVLNCTWTFLVGVFLTSPGCLPTSTVNLLVRQQGEHSAARPGVARPARESRIAAAERLRHFLKL